MPALRLVGDSPEAFEFLRDDRSATDGVIDPYHVSTDQRADPNRLDDEEYLVRRSGHMINVSVETVKIVRALPSLDGTPTSARAEAPKTKKARTH